MIAPALPAAIVAHLAWASIAIGLMVGAAWLACRLRPDLAPATRSTIWWLVAAAALVRLAPVPAITMELPAGWRLGGLASIVPASGTRPTADRTSTLAGEPRLPAPTAVPMAGPASAPSTVPFVPLWTPAIAAAPSSSAIDWRAAVVALWAIVAGGLFLRLAIANRQLRRVAREAEPAPPAIAAEAARLADALGLRETPPVRVSTDVDTPQVLGIFRPTVLLPVALATLTPRERAMTLCHEFAHVRRLDLAFAWAPAILERLLFFHPGARLAAREYAFAREAACDAAVLQHLGEAPRDYGRLLVRLGVTRRPAAFAAAQSSPSTRLLRRRLAMLNAHDPSPRPGRGLWLAGALLVPLAVPLSLVARDAEAILPETGLRAAPATDVRLTGTGLGRDAGPGTGAGADDDQGPPPPPPPPPAARPDVPPPPPPPPPPPADGRGHYWIEGGGQTVVLLDEDGSSVFSGSHQDRQEAQRLRGGSGPFLYVRIDGRTYMSRDRTVIDRVRGELREQRALGRKQADVGAGQGALGEQQAMLGRRQAELAAKMADAGRALAEAQVGRSQLGRMHALQSALAALEGDAGQATAAIDAARRAVSEAIEALRRTSADDGGTERAAERHQALQREMAVIQSRLAADQRALGEKQAALAREQAELGQQQRAASQRAAARIRTIVEKAVAAGEIQPVR